MSDEPRKPKLRYLEPNYDRYKRSKKHENRLSKRLGGKRLPRSGGMAWSRWDKTTAQGDVSLPDFHLEHKRTECESMSVKHDWLRKVADGARRVGKDPALGVTFEERGKAPDDWIMMPLDVFERLLRAAKGNDGRSDST